MALVFMPSYDENLMNNVFFQTLRTEFNDLFLKAISESCVICVPKTDSFFRYLLTLEDFLSHILVPSDELPGSHFSALCGAKVKIASGVLTVDREVGRQNCVHILFHETFYTEDGIKYEVLCVEQPLNEGIASSTCDSNTIILKNFRDCLDFLWSESGSHETITKIDKEVKDFLNRYDDIDIGNLQEIKDSVNSLYVKSIQILLKNSNIKKKYKLQKNKFGFLKIAAETYIQQGIFKKIIKSIAAYTALEDAKLNKIIRNFSDLHFQEFKINLKFFSNIPQARRELSKINGYSTVLGKLECLKKTIVALSESNKDKPTLNADDLVHVLSFLIIKTNLPNWNAQIKFLKLFSHSEFDECSYLIATLEAAIAYVQSGTLLESNVANDNHQEPFKKCEINFLKEINEATTAREKTIYYFFEQVAHGNLGEVKKILENTQSHMKDYSSLNLCHPLCLCDKCSAAFNNACDVSPTVKSCDDQGLTALHIASMYNVPNLVDYLLTIGANCDATDCDGRAPVHYAALRGHQNAILLLLHHNANINALDNSLNTPLHLSSNNGHENCVKALTYFSEYLGVNLKINQQNIKGDTPLHNAAKWGYQNIVRILLEHGSDPMILNKKRFSSVDYAHNIKVLQLLNQKCHNVDHYIKIKPQSPVFDLEDKVNQKTKNQIYKGVQPHSLDTIKKVEKVLRAVENGDVNLVCFFLELDESEFESPGVDDQKTIESFNDVQAKCHPLCTCAKCGHTDVDECEVQKEKNMQKNNLNINACNSDGYTPLHIASRHGNIELVKGFIKNGALLNAQTSTKLWTPLMLACQHQKLKVVKALLEAGCNIDLQDYKLNTALHYGCSTGNTKVVEILLKYEPNINLKNDDNKTALQLAEDKMSLGVIQILKGRPPLDLNDV